MGHISLLYHDVMTGSPTPSGLPGPDADAYKLDQDLFEAHLAKIAELSACRVELASSPEDHKNKAFNSIFLTFDDGGVTADLPTSRLLEARGWRGHFFIITDKVDKPGFLSRQQIRDLHRRGHHIGSHSHSHPECLSNLSYEEILSEWQQSRHILAEILGEAPLSLSVPGGFYSTSVARAARQAGYTIIFNSEPTARIQRLDGLTVFGRYGIKGNTSATRAQNLAAGKLWPRAEQSLYWNLKKPLKKIGGPFWLSFRRWFFGKAMTQSR